MGNLDQRRFRVRTWVEAQQKWTYDHVVGSAEYVYYEIGRMPGFSLPRLEALAVGEVMVVWPDFMPHEVTRIE